MRTDRLTSYGKLEQLRGSKLIVYVTGDRRNLETQVHAEVLDFFVHHLDLIERADKISLLLYTRGGETLAAWSIGNLIRQFCEHFEVIVPSKAHSAGTLICLAADVIVMTKQATLGPIDPSVQNALNPQVPGGPPGTRVPVSVEAINGYLEFARSSVDANSSDLAKIVLRLSQHVHPLVLGEAFRVRSQIRMLGKRLLGRHLQDSDKVEKILEFLCSESGSHDYTINRDEAREELGLRIDKPNDELYAVIRSIYTSIAEELEFRTPYDPRLLIGSQPKVGYAFRRGIIESVAGGTDVYLTEGQLVKKTVQVQPGIMQEALNDTRTFEGWRHEDA